MSDTLALEKLFGDVTAQFTADGTAAKNLFGWNESARQTPGDRCVWYPGDPNGNAGQDAPARNPGRNPRPIGTLLELFTVEITASAPLQPEDELAQYKACRLLRDAWHRAVYLSAHGTFAIKSESWLVDRKVRRAGATLRIVVMIESMIPDEPHTAVPVDTSAVIAVSELDVTETQIETASV